MTLALRGEAAEVALGEAQAVLALVQDDERRGRLADLVAAVQDGELDDDDAQALEELIELGLTTGRIRSVYGPEGEQAALKTYRRLPAGRELADGAREVTDALAALEGKTLERVTVQSSGPIPSTSGAWSRRRGSSSSATRSRTGSCAATCARSSR